jgi:hypothetical protein
MKHIIHILTPALVSLFIPTCAPAQNAAVVKNPQTQAIRDSLLFGTGTTLTIGTGGSLTIQPGASLSGLVSPADLSSALSSRQPLSSLLSSLASLQSPSSSSLPALSPGGASWYPFSHHITPGAIVQRDANGTFSVSSPTSQDHPATRGYVDDLVNERTTHGYAIFSIPLGRISTSKTAEPGEYVLARDFELKGTVSNFGEHTPFTDLVEYYHSPDPNRYYTQGQTGPRPVVYYTWTLASDTRRWIRQPSGTIGTDINNTSIWLATSQGAGFVPAAIVVVPIDSTIRPLNQNLVWSYQRITPNGYEGIWHPVIPSWSVHAPAP